VKCNEGYTLQVDKWCRAELRSEYYNQKIDLNRGVSEQTQLANSRGDVPPDELSVK
ncbi:MAG: hypothetical protein JWO32_1393, partial [Bacteroidetes bacterium]|nr:hypothetical protein [Bacteroidota bacterium]